MAGRTLAKLLALLLMAAVHAAPAWSAQQTSGNGQIHGLVLDPRGAVFPKVGVIIKHIGENLEYSVRTNSSGAYDFTNLPPGSYNVSLQAPPSPVPFKRVQILSVEVTAGNTTNLESHMPLSDTFDPPEMPDGMPLPMPLPTSGDVEGLVLDDYKAVIAEVEVTLDEPVTNFVTGSYLEHRTRTDSEGRYRFLDLRPGKYQVRFYRPHFAQNEVFVSVAVGKIAKPKTRLKTAKPYSY